MQSKSVNLRISNELMELIQAKAIKENRTTSNVIKTILLKEFKSKLNAK